MISTNEGDTLLTMKQLVPVRLLKNKFFDQIQSAELRGATAEELKEILGRARAKRGMFEGDLEEGELEIGQVSAMLNKILPAAEIVKEIMNEYQEAKDALCNSKI